MAHIGLQCRRKSSRAQDLCACAQFGQLGVGSTADSTKPMQVRGLGESPVRLLSCGWRHTIAVNDAGEVYTWGRGVNGQLGHSTLVDT